MSKSTILREIGDLGQMQIGQWRVKEGISVREEIGTIKCSRL